MVYFFSKLVKDGQIPRSEPQQILRVQSYLFF